MASSVTEIRIIVEGGVIQDVLVPPNCPVSVVVHDYDVEGSDDYQHDDEGVPCFISRYGESP